MSQTREAPKATTTRRLPADTADADVALYEAQTEAEMAAEVAAARGGGTLRVGGLAAERTIPVTIRVPVSMVEALKRESERQGLRGYQTLLKQWIEERLLGEPTVSTRQVANALKPLRQLVDAAQEGIH